MASCNCMMILSRSYLTALSPAHSFSSSSLVSFNPFSRIEPLHFRPRRGHPASKPPLSVSASCSLEALIFDCDGVILESEHLHRQAYNDAFSHFNVLCSPSSGPLYWDSDFYDVLQNRIGGGKPKMRWSLRFILTFYGLFSCSRIFFRWFCWGYLIVQRYFKEHGWPSSTIFSEPPENDADRAKLIDTLQVLILFFFISVYLKFDFDWSSSHVSSLRFEEFHICIPWFSSTWKREITVHITFKFSIRN